MATVRSTAVDSGTGEVTELLLAMGRGDASAMTRLVPLVHEELRRLARRQMRRERQGHTLQTTALVNEAYLRLIDVSRVEWKDRGHFYAMSAHLMRRVLVDHARSRRYQKRGGGAVVLPLDAASLIAADRPADLIALDEALTTLARVDERKSHVVEMRFFCGFSLSETAEALGVSVETVSRDWRLAKAWLLREVSA